VPSEVPPVGLGKEVAGGRSTVGRVVEVRRVSPCAENPGVHLRTPLQCYVEQEVVGTRKDGVDWKATIGSVRGIVGAGGESA